MPIVGVLAWGNGEPCPICGKHFEKANLEHFLSHPEAMSTLFPDCKHEWKGDKKSAICQKCGVIRTLKDDRE